MRTRKREKQYVMRELGKSRSAVRLCRGEGCRRRHAAGKAPHLTEARNTLCSSCRGTLEEDLDQMPHLYRACEEVLGGRTIPGGIRERSSAGAATPGIPFNAAAADARTAMLSGLASWASLTADGRGTRSPQRSVEQLSAFLLRHLDWLCSHDSAKDLSAEAAELVRQAQRAAGPAYHRQKTVGTCPESGCTGVLKALLLPNSSVRSAQFRCNADAAHQWTGHELASLGQRMRRAQKASSGASTVWLAPSDIAVMWNMSTGRVYQLAHGRKWRRQTRHGRVFYHEEDVLRTSQDLEPRPA